MSDATEATELPAETKAEIVNGRASPHLSIGARRNGREPYHAGTLDARLAAALSASGAGRTELEALLDEALAALADAEATIERETVRELDIANPNPEQAGDAVRKAERTVARLGQAIPQLRAGIRRLADTEYAQAWNDEADEVEAERDALAAELIDEAVPAITRLANLFTRIEKFDREKISALHGRAPRGEHRRLLGVELSACGMDHFTAAVPSPATNLRLPDPDDPRKLLWPPPVPPVALTLIAQTAALAQRFALTHSPNWHVARRLQQEQEDAKFAKREAKIEQDKLDELDRYHARLREMERRRLGIKGETE